MSTYTPGPWSIDGDLSTALDIIGCAGRIAMIDEQANLSDEELKANAHLIAAAPELLELARQIVLAADDNEGDIPNDIVAGARAAVHKATGGEL